MADINAKNDKFYIAINHYAEEQRTKIEEEIASFKQKELEETEIEVLTECYRMIQKEMSQMRGGILHEMAVRGMNARRELLEKRQKITDDVFSRATESLKAFTEKDEYADFLKKSCKKFSKVFNLAGTVISLKPGDVKHEEQICSAFGGDCSFHIDSEILIGGIRAYNLDMGIIVDETLDTLLEDQREWFEEHSRMTVV